MPDSSYYDNEWDLSPADRTRYQTIFQQNDPQGTGMLTSEQFRPIFLQSKLSPEELFKIWTLVDPSQSGVLDLKQFSAVMHLIFGRIAGKTIPARLPNNLMGLGVPETGFTNDERELIRDLERQVEEKRALLNRGPEPDSLDINKKLQERIRLVYEKVPVHHPELFPTLQKKAEEVSSRLKSHDSMTQSLRGGKVEATCSEIKAVLSEITKVSLECFKLEDSLTHGYTIPSTNAPLIPATPVSQDPIAIKAAAMLAQRMQKLNMANAPTLPADALARVDAYTKEISSDESRQNTEVLEALAKFSEISKQFTQKVENLTQLTSDAKSLEQEFKQVQTGKKFTSSELQELINELSVKSTSLYVPEPPKVVDPPPKSDPFEAFFCKKEVFDPFTQLATRQTSTSPPVQEEPARKISTSNPWANIDASDLPQEARPSVKDFASLFSRPNNQAKTSQREPFKSSDLFSEPSKDTVVSKAKDLFSEPPKEAFIPPPPPLPTKEIDSLFTEPPKENLIPSPPPLSSKEEKSFLESMPSTSPTDREVPATESPLVLQNEDPQEIPPPQDSQADRNPFGKPKSNNPFGIPKPEPDFKFQVRAIYDYSNEGSDLKFEVGDILNVTDDDTAEWYLGHNTALPPVEDWFPRDYVTLEPASPAPEPPNPSYKLLFEYTPLDDQGAPFGDPLEPDSVVEVMDLSDTDWWLVQDPRQDQDGLIYLPASFLEPSS